jgi:hypothetical protein
MSCSDLFKAHNWDIAGICKIFRSICNASLLVRDSSSERDG